MTASAQRADDDAYNAAMKAYSSSPYEYKHELGLCACGRANAAMSKKRVVGRRLATDAPAERLTRARTRSRERRLSPDSAVFNRGHAAADAG